MCAAEFVRNGAVVADIGTDHGYLPIMLLKNGICEYAYASDINRMPLEKARINAKKYGTAEKMSFHISDGLDFVDRGECRSKPDITDIVIMGMGGELISEILDKSGYVKNSGVRLILQPMSMADKLRIYLCENGFGIKDERLCTAAGKIYSVICAEYDGTKRELGEAETLLGENNIERGGELFRKYAENVKYKLKKKIDGLEKGGHDAATETRLYNEIEKILTRGKNDDIS